MKEQTKEVSNQELDSKYSLQTEKYMLVGE